MPLAESWRQTEHYVNVHTSVDTRFISYVVGSTILTWFGKPLMLLAKLVMTRALTRTFKVYLLLIPSLGTKKLCPRLILLGLQTQALSQSVLHFHASYYSVMGYDV